jgi:NAD(P)-dependent dehydrogenase (short-subunit alcohol dehydrogenase family)
MVFETKSLSARRDECIAGTAEAFGRDGARTVAVGRNERALAEVVDAIAAAGGQAIACAPT